MNLTVNRGIAVRAVRVGLVSVLTAVSGAGALSAQQQTVFRSSTDFVRLDVVVTDGDDRPIAGLTADDFEVIDAGRPQAVTDFEWMHAAGSATPARIDAVPPDVATNVPRSTSGRVFVMIVDDLHILESDLVPTRRIMTDFVDALSPDDEAAIVFVSRSDLSQNFTSDRAVLLKTVSRLRDALGFGLDALGRGNGSNIVTDVRFVAAAAQSADRVLKNVAVSLAGSSHPRRAIIYVSGGSVCPTTPSPGALYPSDFEDLQDAYEAARTSGTPIYTIDPRGQVQPADAIRGGIGGIGALDSAADASTQQRSKIVANIRRQQGRLSEIAVTTGGRAFTNQSDLSRAVSEVLGDNGQYYLLGYYPDPFTADGKFHPVTVRVKRAGAHVRARAGYVAVASQAFVDDTKPLLDSALKSGVNSSGLSLHASAAPIMRGAKGVTTAVTIELTYPVRRGGDHAIDDELRLSILAADPDGKVKAQSERTLRFKGTAPDVESLTLLIDDAIELPSQALTVRLGVASRSLSKVGTVQFAVNVPKVSGDRLQMSPLVLGLASANPPALNGTAIRAVLPFQPVLQRTFATSDVVRVFGHLFGKVRSGVSVTAVLEPAAGGATAPPVVTGAPAPDGGFELSLPLTGLVSGDYLLRVSAMNDPAATRVLPITIR